MKTKMPLAIPASAYGSSRAEWSSARSALRWAFCSVLHWSGATGTRRPRRLTKPGCAPSSPACLTNMQARHSQPTRGPTASPWSMTIRIWARWMPRWSSWNSATFSALLCKRHFDQTFVPLLENYGDYIRYVYRDFARLTPNLRRPRSPPSAPSPKASSGSFTGPSSTISRRWDATFISRRQPTTDWIWTPIPTAWTTISSWTRSRLTGLMGSWRGCRARRGFFINGQILSGAQPYGIFERMIQRELDKAGPRLCACEWLNNANRAGGDPRKQRRSASGWNCAIWGTAARRWASIAASRSSRPMPSLAKSSLPKLPAAAAGRHSRAA